MTNTTPPASGRTPSAHRGVTPARQKLTDQLKWKKWKFAIELSDDARSLTASPSVGRWLEMASPRASAAARTKP